ncbi:MAG: methyltransferase domain-containing protein, partial [Bacteroidota bacterium]
RTLELGILLNAAGALAVLLLDGKGHTVRRRVVAVGGGLAFVLLLVLLPPWSQATLLTGVFRFINKNIEPPDSYSSFVRQYESMTILSYDEGTTATVGVIEAPTPEGPQQVLIINGKADASSRTDLPTQVLLGELPMLLHPSPSKALVIGYGSGVTAGSILRHSVERVDCVEISPEVVRAADYFAEASGLPLADARFHLQVEDALAFLQLTDRTYDVIVSEPSNPWIAGIGSLYTSEFFDLCRRRLDDGGLMVQWFHLYEMDDEMFRLVLRTFQASFPSVTLWLPMTTDVILIGAEHPVVPNDERIVRLMSQPQVRDDLRRIAVESPGTLLTLQVLSEQNVRTYAGDGPFNTEDLPRLEYGAPRAFFVNRGVKGLDVIDERIHHSESVTPLQARWAERPFSNEELLNAARWHGRPARGSPLLAYQLYVELSRRHPNDPAIVKMLADIAAQVGRMDESLLLLRKRAELLPRDPIALENYAWKSFEAGNRTANAIVPQRTEESEQLLRRAIALVQDTVDLYRVRLADIMFAGKRYRQAMDQYARAIQIREKHRPDPYIAHDALLTRLALCFYYVDEKPRAAGYALRATQLNPDNAQARDLVYRIWTEGSTPEPQ